MCFTICLYSGFLGFLACLFHLVKGFYDQEQNQSGKDKGYYCGNDSAPIKYDGFGKYLSFCVYDRGGVLLFSATEPSAAWDGTSRGHAMPQGAYVYRIQYTQSNGTRQVKTGTVLLIR